MSESPDRFRPDLFPVPQAPDDSESRAGVRLNRPAGAVLAYDPGDGRGINPFLCRPLGPLIVPT
ncbi:MAG: hypothetical protein KJO06_02920, partial [Gemmatimonadetes bacterium]|nr:hypothetical protein [Gemmatimonadota bacterium]